MLGRQFDAAGIDPRVLEKKVVALVAGKNLSGDPMFAYIEMTLANLYSLKAKIAAQEDFSAIQFGSVLQAGAGLPSRDLRKQMAAKYEMVDLS